MWRSFVILLIAQPTKLSRSMESFRRRSTASPVILFQIRRVFDTDSSGSLHVRSWWVTDLCCGGLTFCCKQRSKKAEHYGVLDHHIRASLVLEDSQIRLPLQSSKDSSLAWASKDRVNSKLARRDNIVYTTLSMHLDAKVAVTTHIPGKLNIIFDGLSRLLSPADVGLDISLEYNARDDVTLLRILQLCDPEAIIDTIDDHIHVLTSCQQLLSA